MDDFFESFKTSVLYPGATAIGGAVTTKVVDKITGASGGGNLNTNDTISAIAPSGASSMARAINEALAGQGRMGMGMIIPLVLLSGAGLYLVFRK